MVVKKVEQNKYELDLTIKWSDLNRIWNETKKIKGFKSFFRYMIYYGKYAPLANFGAKIINEYHIPYKQVIELYKEEKK